MAKATISPLVRAISRQHRRRAAGGLQTRGDRDVPYWPVQSTWTYKEVWVHPVARWIWLMRDLAGPALVEGQADSPVEFIATSSERERCHPGESNNGQFRAMLPEGKYTVRCHGEEQARDFLPAGTYHLDLRPGRALDFDISKRQSEDGEVRIRVNARGTAATVSAFARITSRSRGAEGIDPETREHRHLEWRGQDPFSGHPLDCVVIADDNPAIRKELTGAAWEP